MPQRKKDIPWSLRQLLVKIGLTAATIAIGLYCGFTASYAAFYVAVLVQALNNAYESFTLLAGYNKFITLCHAVSFLGATGSAVLAILFFAGAPLAGQPFVFGITTALSIPVVHFLIEAFILWWTGKY